MRYLFLFLLLAGGCSTTIVPPPNPAHPTTVLISDYGRHSSLLLPDPEGGMVEYAFGDYAWFAAGHQKAWDAIHAVILSPKSTLGRRRIFMSPESPDLAARLGMIRLHALTVDSERVALLRIRLDYEFDLHNDQVIYNPIEQMYMVPCDEQYNLFRNCNQLTGEWLRELGAKTHGPCMTARFDVAPSPGDPALSEK